MENEGYYGTMTSAARSNHRIVQMQINGEAWGFNILRICILMSIAFCYLVNIHRC